MWILHSCVYSGCVAWGGMALVAGVGGSEGRGVVKVAIKEGELDL